MRTEQTVRTPDEGVAWVSALPFLAFHLAPLAIIATGVSWGSLWLCAALYYARIILITAGYHRFFSHRSFRMGRVAQTVTAALATTAAQKGPLWWAGHHRRHHRYSDTERDIHSPRRGFVWSHVGWVLSRRYKRTDLDAVPDLARRPELLVVDRLHWLGPWILGTACYLAGGWRAVVVGFSVSTIVLWHATFAVNSLAHKVGSRRYDTPDDSRNSLPIALLTAGEGWHNNHHHMPSSARQGLCWWEVDTSYYVLRGLECAHLVRDVRRPTPKALRTRRSGDRSSDTALPLGRAATRPVTQPPFVTW